jgi:hypothetical protein
MTLLRSLSMADKPIKGLLVVIGLAAEFVSVSMLGITGDVSFVVDGGSGGQTRALGKRHIPPSFRASSFALYPNR